MLYVAESDGGVTGNRVEPFVAIQGSFANCELAIAHPCWRKLERNHYSPQNGHRAAAATAVVVAAAASLGGGGGSSSSSHLHVSRVTVNIFCHVSPTQSGSCHHQVPGFRVFREFHGCHILGCAALLMHRKRGVQLLRLALIQQFSGVSSLGVAWPCAAALTSAPASLGARHHRGLPGSRQSAGS
jgi:hypothetical protein